MVLNNWKIALMISTIVIIIWFTHFLNSGSERRFNEFKARGYSGVIKEIRRLQSHRGCPDILIRNEWIFLTLDEQVIFDQIHIGDSIVKQAGSDKITIFRMDSLSKIETLEFVSVLH
ncbi:MAG: hypothetical protein HOP30_02960 [Cyclobacteriaceae bacterium]|nr:hypothetical protein [Cyclobacteriaceae bacterium]